MQEKPMNPLFNKVLLNRKTAVALEVSTHSADDIKITALMADIAQLGYTLNNDVMTVLKTYSDAELAEFHQFLVSELKVMVGAHVRYIPLFKNFPKGIPDTMEHVLRRILGYFENQFKVTPADYDVLSCGHIIDKKLFNLAEYNACPICEHQVDELMDHDDSHKAVENTHQFKIITLTNEVTVYKIFSNLVSSRSPISEDDKSFIISMVEHEGNNIGEYIPDDISQKEIVALLGGLLLKITDIAEIVLTKHVKTSTDVLRLAVQLCGGDISLKENTKFKLTNPQRRIIMTLLNKIKYPEIDMMRYRSMWQRLGEVLHIGSKKDKYPVAFEAFDNLRNHSHTIETFNRKVEQLLTEATTVKNNKSQIEDVLKLLSSRAGDFARRLDYVLRLSTNKTIVIASFKTIIHLIPTPLILSLKAHFEGRSEKSEFRFFVPKGKMAKVQFIEGDNREIISEVTIKKLIKLLEKELDNRFSKEESLGKVFIDESLKKILVPLSQRSASKALFTVPRGSRMKVDSTAPFVRLFTYWKAPVDVDLGAIAFDENWQEIDHLNYYALSSFGQSVHSGDIQNGRNGAVEFIDLDIEAFKRMNVRYVAVTIIVYTGEHFSEFECSAGFMERQSPDGRQFDATTVKQKFDVSADGTYEVPMIFDLETSELIWVDLALSGSDMHANYHNSSSKLINIAKVAVKLADIKPNLYDLFSIQAKARGTKVDFVKNPKVEYDQVFDLETAKNLDEIVSKWMK